MGDRFFFGYVLYVYLNCMEFAIFRSGCFMCHTTRSDLARVARWFYNKLKENSPLPFSSGQVKPKATTYSDVDHSFKVPHALTS